jgi:probable RNA-binding protein EIF1AD
VNFQLVVSHNAINLYLKMGRSKREVLAIFDDTLNPPATLPNDHAICRVLKATGNSLFNVENAEGNTLLVELPAQFRSKFWIKRGGYVLVNKVAFAERENKLDGEIVNLVGEERIWRKLNYWPKEFEKKSAYEDSDDGEEKSNVGEMPPGSDDEG